MSTPPLQNGDRSRHTRRMHISTAAKAEAASARFFLSRLAGPSTVCRWTGPGRAARARKTSSQRGRRSAAGRWSTFAGQQRWRQDAPARICIRILACMHVYSTPLACARIKLRCKPRDPDRFIAPPTPFQLCEGVFGAKFDRGLANSADSGERCADRERWPKRGAVRPGVPCEPSTAQTTLLANEGRWFSMGEPVQYQCSAHIRSSRTTPAQYP